jgi:hypothetical protein
MSGFAGPVELRAFLDDELRERNLDEIPAVDAAAWLDAAGLLVDSSSRPGLPLRKLLRAGLLPHVYQRPARPNGRWFIMRSPERSASFDASRKGKAVEHLVAATCILASGGELNVSTSLVDDEGVDLVFHRRGRGATLGVQVKSRTVASKQLTMGTFRANVRSQTFRPRDDLYLLFVAIDTLEATYGPVWLVPSEVLARTLKPRGRGRYVFVASAKEGSLDRWRPYRFSRQELPGQLLKILRDLELGRSSD